MCLESQIAVRSAILEAGREIVSELVLAVEVKVTYLRESLILIHLSPSVSLPQELQSRIFTLHTLSSMSPYGFLGLSGHLTRLDSGIPQEESRDLSLCIDDDNGRDFCFPSSCRKDHLTAGLSGCQVAREATMDELEEKSADVIVGQILVNALQWNKM